MARHVAATLIGASALLAQAAEAPATAPSPSTYKGPYVCQMASHAHMAAMGPAKEYDKPGICPTDGMELIAKNSRLNVAVLVFDGVQDIDYAGPMEVFGQSGAKIFTVAASTDALHSVFGVKLTPDYDLEHAPAADVLIIPGGNVGAFTHNPAAIAWLQQRSTETRTVLSVCTGAFILGKAGLLDGLNATTIAGAIPQLAKAFPKAHVVNNRRYTDNGKIVTTAGLSAGIDGALHVVDRELGRLRAEDIARGIEYDWNPDGKRSFAELAGNVMPDVAVLLPEGASWERLVERGDMKQWEMNGQMEISISAAEFLDNGVAKLKADDWKVQTGKNALQRSFTKTKDGRTWQLVLSLANERAPSVYHLSMKLKQSGLGQQRG
jgi:putative intracellular protease/amidase